MTHSRGSTPSLLICLAVLAGCALLLMLQPVALLGLRHALFDQFQRWQPRVYQDTAVRVVDLDEESLRRLGQWPWPRDQVARLVTALRDAGATVIVFDVLFAEPDRASPTATLARLDLPAALADQLAALPDPDRQLAATIADQPVVLGFAAVQQANDAGPPLARYGLASDGPPPLASLPNYVAAVRPLPALERAAQGIGALVFRPDADGVVRRVPLLIAVAGEIRPSLVAETLRLQQRAQAYRIATDGAGMAALQVGALRLPTSADGELWVHYSRPQAQRTLPAWRVMAGQADDSLRGRIALIGTSAQGLQDLRFSPLGGIVPGVEVHAQALEQALAGHFLLRPAWAPALEMLALLLGSAVLGLITLRGRALPAALSGAALLAGFNLAGWLAFARAGLLIDLATPSLGLLLMYLCASLLRHRATERQQRWLRAAFSRYVSPNLVEHLVAHPEQLALGGDRRPCSFVFTDISGFTEMVERQAPEALVSLLNDYLDGVVRIIFEHQGTIDRIVGDGVAVMFSAPLHQADHAQRALACGLAIQRFASDYVDGLRARGVAFGRTRIGIHSGEVVVGNFGGSRLFDYRALGDAVNSAARLEALNAQVGTWVCVSAAIRAQCPDTPMRAVGEVLLRGKALALEVFEPLDAPDAAYDAAYRLLADADRGAALAAFTGLQAQRPDDALVAFHLNRLQNGESGVRFVMTGK